MMLRLLRRPALELRPQRRGWDGRASFGSGRRFASSGFFRPSVEGPRTMYDKIFDDHVSAAALRDDRETIVTAIHRGR